MNTFFLQRGIRLSISKEDKIAVRTVDIEDNTHFDAQLLAPVASPLEAEMRRFKSSNGKAVILRLADVDPFCQAQRAETAILRDDSAAVFELVASLKQLTGISQIVAACHKGQDIGFFQEAVSSIIRTHPAHYPMLSTPSLAAKLQKAPPVLTRDLKVKGVLATDIGDLLNMLTPNRKFVVSVTTPECIVNLRIQRGVTVRQVLASARLPKNYSTVIVGSPLTGEYCRDMNAQLCKDSLCAGFDAGARCENLPCCNCGKCVKACPARLLPGLLSKHIYAASFEAARALDVDACIECGCCAYVCPSSHPMVAYMRRGKTGVAAQ